MLQKRNLLLVFSAILSLLLVACGATAGNDGDGDAQAVSLPQNLSYEDSSGGTISVDYPEGWVSDTINDSINLASSEELLEQASSGGAPNPASGEVLTTVFIVSPDMAAFFIGDSEESSVLALANAFASDSSSEEETIGEAEEITINGNSAAIVTGNTEGVDIVLTVVDLGEGSYAMTLGGTAEGEGDSIRATVEAIAASLSYEAGATEE